MGKNLSDEDWDKLLEEQYLKEADFLEEELFSGDDWDDDEEETEEEVQAAYEDLVARLRARGEYREEETEAGVDAEKKEVIEKVVPMSKKKQREKSSFKAARVAGFAFVGVLCVFAASLTGEANRKYFINTVDYLRGNDTWLVIDNDERNEKINESEGEAVECINMRLGIEIPELFYRPDNFKFLDFDFNEVAKFALVEYEYEDMIVTLYSQKKDSASASVNFSLHGEKITTVELNYGKILADVFEIKAEGDVLPSYTAQWEWNNVSYQFNGKIKEKNF